ncbi:MAG: signal peptidase II [Acidimicrobiia bacterium]
MENDGDRLPRRRALRAWTIAAVVLGIVAADQLTKAWAVSRLADGPIAVIGDTVDLRLARNPGGAFSLFRTVTPLLAVFAIVVAFFLVRTVRDMRDRPTAIALALILGGALGNLVDRLVRSPGFLRGHVVDFVHVGVWPTFNVADSAITVGAVLLVVRTVMVGNRETEADSQQGREEHDGTHGER